MRGRRAGLGPLRASVALAVVCAACGDNAPPPLVDPGTSGPPVDTVALSAAFAEHDVVGTMVVRRLSDGATWLHAPARADSGFVPASTFKIVNAAIALESGVVEGPDDTFLWDGEVRSIEAWNRDHTLLSAMAVSAVPVYQRIARATGPERMARWVERLGYGNATIGDDVDRFWLDGPLRTSAAEQVDFLARLVSGRTPLSPGTVEIVGALTLVEDRPDGALHAKTGWADVAEVGWWSGWTIVGDETYAFSLNIVMPDAADAPKRIAVGRQALAAIGALPGG